MHRSAASTVLFLLLSAAVCAQPPARVRLEGESIDTLQLAVRLDGVDFRDAVSVAQAKAEIDAALESRLELQFALVLAGELASGYRGLVDADTLRRESARPDLDSVRRQVAALAAARIEVSLGAPQAEGDSAVLVPYTATLRNGDRVLTESRHRVRLVRSAEGTWSVARDETACGDCAGAGKASGRPCAACRGAGWIVAQRQGLPEGLRAERPGTPAEQATPAKAAVAFLSHRLALSRWILAGFAAKVGPGYREYCRRFFAPAAIPASEPPASFSAPVTYEAGEEAQEPAGVSLMVKETAAAPGARPAVAWMRVNLVSPAADRWTVVAFGLSCPSCQGTGKCALCRGTGLTEKGSPCDGCEGTKTCVSCQGKRVIPADLFTPRW